MKQATGPLNATLYGSSSYSVVDLYTFTTRGGTTRWTDATSPVVSGSTTWSLGPVIETEEVEQMVGTEVGRFRLTLHPNDGDTLDGSPVVRAAYDGALDGSRVRLDRAWLDATGSVVGTASLFAGPIDEVEPTSEAVGLSFTSDVGSLRGPLSLRIVQPTCPYSLYDSNCAVASGSHTHDRTTVSGSTAAAVVLSSLSTVAKKGSTLEVIDGPMAGQVRVIASVVGTTASLGIPLTAAPAPGTTVRIRRGCNKTLAPYGDTDGCSTFNNVANFGGFPWAPAVYDFYSEKGTYDLATTGNRPVSPPDPGQLRRRGTLRGPAVPIVYGKAIVDGVPVSLHGVGSSVNANWTLNPWAGLKKEQVGDEYVVSPTTGGNLGGPAHWGRPVAQVAIAFAVAPVTGVSRFWMGDFEFDVDLLDGSTTSLALADPELVLPIDDPARIVGWYNSPSLTEQGQCRRPTLVTGSEGAQFPAAGPALRGVAHLRASGVLPNGRYATLAMDDSGRIPASRFEVIGRCWDASLSGAHPADVLVDMLTDPQMGVGLPASVIDVDHGPDGSTSSSYRTYCTALGLRVNAAIDDDTPAADLVDQLMVATNSECVWSEGRLRVVPWGDRATGSYVPPTASFLLDADEIDGDLLDIDRATDDDVFNEFPIKASVRDPDTGRADERTWAYRDDVDAAVRGPRIADEQDNVWISDPDHAVLASQWQVLRSINRRNAPRFRVGPRWALLDPMDAITVRDPVSGLDVLCRVRELKLGEDGISVEAWEWREGHATAVDLTAQRPSGSVLPPFDLAIVQSTEAAVTASEALVTASAAYATASSALAIASSAFSTATLANAYASGALSTASLAQATASSAYTFSSGALATSSIAVSSASIALASATLAQAAATSASVTASAANDLAIASILANEVIVVNGGFEQGTDGWSLHPDHRVVSGGAAFGSYCLELTSSTTASGARDSWSSNYFETKPGEVLYAEAWLSATIYAVSGSGRVDPVLFEFSDQNKTNRSWAAITSITSSNGGWTRYTGSVTVPAGKYYVRAGPSCRSFSGSARWDNVFIRRFVSGAFILPGTVTTIHISASSVTSDKIDADAIETRHLQVGTIIAAQVYADYGSNLWPNGGSLVEPPVSASQDVLDSVEFAHRYNDPTDGWVRRLTASYGTGTLDHTFHVHEGTSLFFKSKMKLVSGKECALDLTFFDKNGTSLGVYGGVMSTAGAWGLRYCGYTAPTGTATARATLRVTSSGSQSGSALFDGITLTDQTLEISGSHLADGSPVVMSPGKLVFEPRFGLSPGNSAVWVDIRDKGISDRHLEDAIKTAYARRAASAHQYFSSRVANPVLFDYLGEIVGSAPSYSGGVFTMPVAGVYQISASVIVNHGGNWPSAILSLIKNGGVNSKSKFGPTDMGTGEFSIALNTHLYLGVNDQVAFRLDYPTGNGGYIVAWDSWASIVRVPLS